MNIGSEQKTGLGKTPSGHLIVSVEPAVEMTGGTATRPPETGNPPTGWPDHWTVPAVCIFLAAIVWLVFGQTLRHDFVNLDDNVYVYDNPTVQKGLTFQGIIWAFTHVWAFNWHPLTWISHMLDCQLYGLNASGHHLTNVLLHTATAVSLFLVLRRMTGFLWRSAFVAALFAIHPLRVESVAWVAERKDVLSGLFFILTIGAYVRYARLPWSPARYGLVVLLFALGLMCKPMLVTVPFVLLLLDYWPLNRLQSDAGTEPIFQFAGWRIPKRLIYEKLPLFGLTVASCAITVFAQTRVIQSSVNLSLPLRVGNASISYVTYMDNMFWPSDLAVLYPLTAKDVSGTSVALSLVVLAGISTGVVVLRRRPYLLTGWLWYLIMLVPVIGILQVGLQARADRYTYLPQIGLYLLLTWAVADLFADWRHRRIVLGGGATIILVALIFCARAQTAYWQNSELLWTHALDCTSDNAEAHNNLGTALLQKGKVNEAMVHFQKALQINPNLAETHGNLGTVLVQQGRMDDAIAQYQKALQINPDYAEAHNNLGNALLQQGRIDDAIAQYQKALQINPDYAEASYDLGNAFSQKGSMDEAIANYKRALQINPSYIAAQNNLAWVLATSPLASLRDGNQAVALAQRANQLIGGGNPIVLHTLAAAYAETGQFPEAVETAQRALHLAETQSNAALADGIGSELKLYRTGRPLHSP